MLKALAQFAILAVLFFGTWFLLGNIDFVKHFKVEQLTRESERKLGEMILDAVTLGNRELELDSVQTFVEGIKQRICAANNIPDTTITLHVFIRKNVNAFALPDRQLVVYTSLISYCKNPEELAGVVAHEIAHMEHQHVMQKLVKEVGISMLMTVGGGDAGQDIAMQMVKLLSSTAFDREQENEADLSAVHMMAKANIDPEHFANILFRLSQEKNNIPRHFEWVSTHANSQDRASEILKLRKLEKFNATPITDSTAWASIRNLIKNSGGD